MRDYVSHVTPFLSDFADETLMVSDAMGYESDPDFLIDRNHFNNNLIMYVLSGRLVAEQYGETHDILPGHGILMDLRDTHKYYFGEKGHTEILWLHFRGTPVDAVINHLHAGSMLPLHFEDTSFETHFAALYRLAAAKQLPNEFDFSCAVYSILMHVCKTAHINEPAEMDGFALAVSRYIYAHLDDPPGLDAFAGHMKMSKYHFCRKFRQEFDCTPLEYIQQQKINKAKRLLIYTTLPAAEIACRLSFYDQSHFCRVFTRLTGTSPGKFRKGAINTQF